VLTSPLAVIEAHRNLEVKRPDAVTALDRWLTAVTLVREPSPAVVDRLAPVGLAGKDRPVLAAALAARAIHFVTGDRRDFGRWMDDSGELPLRVVTNTFMVRVLPPWSENIGKRIVKTPKVYLADTGLLRALAGPSGSPGQRRRRRLSVAGAAPEDAAQDRRDGGTSTRNCRGVRRSR